MVLTYDAPFSRQFKHLQPDMKFGGMRAESTLDVSAELARYLNSVAANATGLLKGEWINFEAGEYFGVALPTLAVPTRDQYLHMYNRARLVIDGQLSLRLADYPRFFSATPAHATVARGGPTWIPTSVFPPDTFGRVHAIELFDGEERIFGPAERLFHRGDSGPVFARVVDGEGCLGVEIGGNLGALGNDALVMANAAVVFIDPRFGELIKAEQVHASGERRELECELVGRDYVGATHLFNESVVRGIQLEEPQVRLEVLLPNKATGLAGGLGGGHIKAESFRANATVR